jgi:hypothetical protein
VRAAVDARLSDILARCPDVPPRLTLALDVGPRVPLAEVQHVITRELEGRAPDVRECQDLRVVSQTTGAQTDFKAWRKIWNQRVHDFTNTVCVV